MMEESQALLNDSLSHFVSLREPPEYPPSNVPPNSIYIALPLNHGSILSPKARLAGLCQAMGFSRSPTYEVEPGEHAGYLSTVCIYPPPEPHTELRLHCATLCNGKRDAELAAANQAMKILLRASHF